MPELPEVETVVRSLRKTIVGQVIAGAIISDAARISPERRRFAALTAGARVLGVRRRGKNILIDLSNDHTLWVHLKMTGHFSYHAAAVPGDRHDHVVFQMDQNGHCLRFNDYRRFGRLRLLPTAGIMQSKGLAELGPEPLEINANAFVARVKSTRRMIKPALLDQTFLAGMGNIYADEALHLARIHPRRRTDSLSSAKLRELHGYIQQVLKRAIRMMGTSVDTFTGVNGRPGRYQECLLVYGNEGQPCRACGCIIRREKIGSRSAHYCPRCQRRP
jgi:formamidopyrimidine-DNA glycosylase